MPGEFRRHEYMETDGGPASFVTTHVVDDGHDGCRADLFLKEKLRRKSRAFIQKAIADGRILLSSRALGEMPRLKPSTMLQVGDEVQVITDRSHPEPPVDFDYKILLEDEHVLVIDKPGNLPVHPAGRFFFNTLLSRLRHDRLEDFHNGRDFYLVHRIDRETSGILIIGKSSKDAGDLVAQFREHKVEKRYLAVVQGRVEADEFVVDKALAHDPVSNVRLKMAVTDAPDGLPSYTGFRVLRRTKRFTLVECAPRTGRQHQIRVHLASVGHPIVGDKLYGGVADVFLSYLERRPLTDAMHEALILKRQALHACSLRFRHPITKADTTITSPLPRELQELLDGDAG